MDTDVLPSATVFVAFLVLFSYLSMLRHSGASPADSATDSSTSRWTESIIFWLRSACVIAVALSGLALVHSIETVGWWPVSFLALALLFILASIDRLAEPASRRSPDWAFPWQRAVNRQAAGGREGRIGITSNGSEGDSVTPGETFAERPQPAITVSELVGMDQRDHEMLRSILRLDVTTAREIMVPRLDVVAVDSDSSLVQVIDQMIKGGHSRLPVYEETIDRILGIIHAMDVMACMAAGDGEQSLRDLVRPAFIIPETKRLDDLLEELQDKGIQMAIVVDEHGGTEGVVTMEDVLEEIVGEIEDEFSRTRESSVVHLPDGGLLVDAGMTTESVQEMFDTQIDSTDVDTVGGYVYHSLGKIPQVGDSVVTDHLQIEVVSVLGRRLRRLRIKRIDKDGSIHGV